MRKRLTTEEFIERARQVHGDRYDYSKTEYEHSKKNVCIICPIHGEFWMRPNNHLNGQGCAECSGTKALTQEIFIERVKQVHGNKYDYSKVVYKNNKAKICVICPKHGEFLIGAAHFLNGVGCKKCSSEKKRKMYTKPLETFIEESRQVHNNKYDYSKVDYINGDTKVKIICPIHGEFFQTPHNHIRGNGCPQCKRAFLNKVKTKGTAKFIEQAKEIHGDKYDYSKVEYTNKDKKVCIICPVHGEFLQSPKVHLQGHGCPTCKSSKLEMKIEALLSENSIKFIAQCGKTNLEWLQRQRLDFYLPDYKIGIECQGGQHFKPVKRFGGDDTFKSIIIRDKRKKQLCNEHNVRLLYFSDKQYEDNIITDENKLLEEIKKNGI